MYASRKNKENEAILSLLFLNCYVSGNGLSLKPNPAIPVGIFPCCLNQSNEPVTHLC